MAMSTSDLPGPLRTLVRENALIAPLILECFVCCNSYVPYAFVLLRRLAALLLRYVGRDEFSVLVLCCRSAQYRYSTTSCKRKRQVAPNRSSPLATLTTDRLSLDWEGVRAGNQRKIDFIMNLK